MQSASYACDMLLGRRGLRMLINGLLQPCIAHCLGCDATSLRSMYTAVLCGKSAHGTVIFGMVSGSNRASSLQSLPPPRSYVSLICRHTADRAEESEDSLTRKAVVSAFRAYLLPARLRELEDWATEPDHAVVTPRPWRSLTPKRVSCSHL